MVHQWVLKSGTVSSCLTRLASAEAALYLLRKPDLPPPIRCRYHPSRGVRPRGASDLNAATASRACRPVWHKSRAPDRRSVPRIHPIQRRRPNRARGDRARIGVRCLRCWGPAPRRRAAALCAQPGRLCVPRVFAARRGGGVRTAGRSGASPNRRTSRGRVDRRQPPTPTERARQCGRWSTAHPAPHHVAPGPANANEDDDGDPPFAGRHAGACMLNCVCPSMAAIGEGVGENLG